MKLLSRVWLCDLMGCSPPGSSVHGIFQAWILECLAIFCSRGSSRPRNQTQVFWIVGRHFTIWATKETMACRSSPIGYTFPVNRSDGYSELFKLWARTSICSKTTDTRISSKLTISLKSFASGYESMNCHSFNTENLPFGTPVHWKIAINFFLFFKMSCLGSCWKSTRASHVDLVVKNPLAKCRRHKRRRINPCAGKIPWRKAWQPTQVFLSGKYQGQRDWRATVQRVAKSQTGLMGLCMHMYTHMKQYKK